MVESMTAIRSCKEESSFDFKNELTFKFKEDKDCGRGSEDRILLFPRRKHQSGLEEIEPSRARDVVEVSIEMLTPFFHRPLPTAANHLGVCVTTMKRICRRLGLKRWPYTKGSGTPERKEDMKPATHSAHAAPLAHQAPSARSMPSGPAHRTPEPMGVAPSAPNMASSPASDEELLDSQAWSTDAWGEEGFGGLEGLEDLGDPGTCGEFVGLGSLGGWAEAQAAPLAPPLASSGPAVFCGPAEDKGIDKSWLFTYLQAPL